MVSRIPHAEGERIWGRSALVLIYDALRLIRFLARGCIFLPAADIWVSRKSSASIQYNKTTSLIARGFPTVTSMIRSHLKGPCRRWVDRSRRLFTPTRIIVKDVNDPFRLLLLRNPGQLHYIRRRRSLALLRTRLYRRGDPIKDDDECKGSSFAIQSRRKQFPSPFNFSPLSHCCLPLSINIVIINIKWNTIKVALLTAKQLSPKSDRLFSTFPGWNIDITVFVVVDYMTSRHHDGNNKTDDDAQ